MSVTAVPIRPIRKGSLTKFWIALVLLMLAAAAVAWFGTAGQNWLATSSGLKYQVVEEGEGPKPGPTDIVKFEYVGTLPDGTEFDRSQGEPVEIPVFGLVPGFSEGLQLMSKGATYKLRIPPDIGYGPQGRAPVIPPNTDILFEVKLSDFRRLTAEEMQQMQMMQQMMQQQQMRQMEGGGAPQGQ